MDEPRPRPGLAATNGGEPPVDARQAPSGSPEPFWEDWIRSAPGISQPADRRRARMLAGFSLVLAVAALVSSLVALFMGGPRFGNLGYQVSGISGTLLGFVAVPLLIVAYLLARTTRWRWGAYLTVGLTLVLSLASAAASAWVAGDHRIAVYVAIPLLVAGSFLGLSETLTTAGLGIAGVLSMALWVPGTAYGDIHPSLVFLGMVIALVVLFTTIRSTDLRQLTEQTVELNQAQEIAGLGSWSLDIPTGQVRWSRQMYRLYGIDPGTEVTLETAMEGIHEADAQEIQAEYERVLESGGQKTGWGPIEYRFTSRDGIERVLYAEARAWFDDQGRARRLTGTVQDITEQRALESRFEQLLEAAPDAIVLVDTDGDIVLVNQQTESLFGWDREELLGEPVETLVPLPLREEHVGYRDAYMADPESRPMGLNLELYGLHKDGSEIPVEIGLAPLVTEDGMRVMAAVRDMTERAQIKEELRAYANRLERSNRDWEHFAYVVSHDLQEPIRMVNSYLQLLVRRYEGELDEQADEYIGYAKEGAQRMRKLILGLLEYSRVDTQGGQRREVDSANVLESVLNALQVSIRDRQARVRYNDLPTVLADEGQLGQVLQNILANALKFVPEDREPEIRISAEREGETWHFRVRDNGIGINPEHADQIFVIFRRLNARGEFEGEGIGLAVCKKIIERHGGRIWVTDNQAHGSTFHFTLPCSKPAGLAATEPGPAGEPLMEGERHRPHGTSGEPSGPGRS